MSAKQIRQGVRLNIKKAVDKISPQIRSGAIADNLAFTVAVQKLEKLSADLNQHDMSVFGSLPAEEVEAEIQKTAEYNDTVLDWITQGKVLLQKSMSPSSSSSSAGFGSSKQGNLKLPKIELPSFDGDALQWQGFWDSFENAVHKNAHLSEIDKFNYLRGLLSEEAARVADGYRLTAANYSKVITALHDRFGSRQRAIFGHIEAMMSLPSATHDLDSLQSVSDSCNSHIRSLEALGLDEATFGEVFTPMILFKLPKYVKIELQRRLGSSDWSLSKVREYLKDEIRARELGQWTDPGQSGGQTDGTQGKYGGAGGSGSAANRGSAAKRTGAALVTATANKNPINCVFCGEGHYSDTCMKFPTAEDRPIQLGNKCFKCLRQGHGVKTCLSKMVCVHCQKSGYHRSLCFQKFGKPGHSKSEVKPGVQFEKASMNAVSGLNAQADPFLPRGASKESSLVASGTVKRTILQTALVTVQNAPGTASVQCRLLMDTAASRSFIVDRVRRSLGLPVLRKEWMSIAGFGNNKRRTSEYEVVEFFVQCLDGSFQRMEASVNPNITAPIQKLPIDPACLEKIKGLPLAEPIISQPELVQIDILVGAEFYYKFILKKRVEIGPDLLFLESKLGYVATGQVDTNLMGADTIAVMILQSGPGFVDRKSGIVDLEGYWRLEEIGIKNDSDDQCHDEDAVSAFNAAVKLVDRRYSVKWPWKNDTSLLGDNFSTAYSRLGSLVKRFRHDPEILRSYSDIIGDQLDKNMIEPAPDVPTGDKVYYLPHHALVKPERTTTKIELQESERDVVRFLWVKDPTEKLEAPNLVTFRVRTKRIALLSDIELQESERDMVRFLWVKDPTEKLEAPNLLTFRVRTKRIALLSDIEKAFHQIELQESERDVVRFLWVKDPTEKLEAPNLVTYRFRVVPFGVISSPFLLGATINHHLQKSNTPVAQQIMDNLYADNAICGVDSVAEGLAFYKEAKGLFDAASMNLREWYTNSPVLAEQFGGADKGKSENPKILGVSWNSQLDTIGCSAPKAELVANIVISKRVVLQHIAKTFDPCGFFCPVTVVGKMIVQDLWRLGIGWDDEVPADMLSTWNKFVLCLERVSVSGIPRFIGPVTSTAQLHLFCDASAKAFAAVAYLRVICGDVPSSNLLFSRSRLAPVRHPQTIPRLELVAVVTGVEVMQFVETQLKIAVPEKYIWTDSQCTLHWLQREQVSTPFVENRLQKIRRVPGLKFRYVPTSMNPADLPTRGVGVDALSESRLWWNGPEYLVKDQSLWPASKCDIHIAVETELAITENAEIFEPIVDPSRFSGLPKLVRSTAWILRFCHNASVSVENRQTGHLSSGELIRAMVMLLKWTQRSYFPDLVQNRGTAWPKGLGKELTLFVDNVGLLRSSGRIAEADVPYDTKYPILLPHQAPLTKLIILDIHTRLQHAWVRHTLAASRCKYWVLRGRSTVRHVLRNCKVCVRAKGGPFRVPDFPPLPKERVSEAHPFENTGLDYMGPLWVKDADGSFRKVWVCLFTCMVVRAIHLELVGSLSAGDFLMALRRFVANHQMPKVIVSDNATTFRSADRTIQKLWSETMESEVVQGFAGTRGMEWRFVTEYAPWMGGFYERLVGLVKDAMKKVLGRSTVSETELSTLLCEITAVVNSRPLCHVEPEITGPYLSPSSFLGSGRHDRFPDFHSDTDTPYEAVTNTGRNELILAWKRHQGTLSMFWDTWRKQYLLSLRARAHSHKQRNCSSAVPKVGSVVQIYEKTPRSEWKIGKIIGLPVGRDGQVRSATVKLPSGKSVLRPLKLLYPLEVVEYDTQPVNTTNPPTADGVNTPRPKRASAQAASVQIREQLADSEEDDAD